MVGVVKKLVGIIGFLFITTLAYAAPVVNISVSGIPNAVKLSEIRENGVTLSIYFTCVECEKILRNTEYLEVYVVKEPQNIIYQDILPVDINRSKLTIYSLPGYIFENEGIYYIRFTYRALTTLGTEIRTDKETSILATEVEGSALEITRLSPDLSKDIVFRFDRIPQTFRVEIFNTYEEMQFVTVKIEILDNLGRILLSRSTNARIYAFQRTFVEVPVDFSLLLPGEYTLVLTVNRGPYEVYRVERKIIVGEDQYVSVRLYDIRQYPFTVKTGEFVELKLLLKNVEDNPTKAKIIIMSKELGIYRESETIEFDARETKTVNYVLRIPKVEAKNYDIEILIQTDVATRKYTYRLYVEGEKPQPVEINLLPPARLEIEKEGEGRLVFKSNVEALNEFKLRIYADGAEVTYPATVTVGGKGNIVEVPIIIKPTSVKSTITVEVYDTSGNLVFNKTETYGVVVGAEKIYSYVIKALIIIILIILAVILYYTIESRRKKKRKIEKAE